MKKPNRARTQNFWFFPIYSHDSVITATKEVMFLSFCFCQQNNSKKLSMKMKSFWGGGFARFCWWTRSLRGYGNLSRKFYRDRMRQYNRFLSVFWGLGCLTGDKQFGLMLIRITNRIKEFLLEFLSLRKKANSVIILRDQLAQWRFAVSEWC